MLHLYNMGYIESISVKFLILSLSVFHFDRTHTFFSIKIVLIFVILSRSLSPLIKHCHYSFVWLKLVPAVFFSFLKLRLLSQSIAFMLTVIRTTYTTTTKNACSTIRIIKQRKTYPSGNDFGNLVEKSAGYLRENETPSLYREHVLIRCHTILKLLGRVSYDGPE